jgi:hypothetical protein
MPKKKGRDASDGVPDEKPLRHHAEVERAGDDDADEAAQARARLDAIRQTREMSTSDEPPDEQNKGRC